MAVTEQLGYHFKMADCKVIGRLDESGNVVPLAPETLSHQVLSTFPGYDRLGNPLQTEAGSEVAG